MVWCTKYPVVQKKETWGTFFVESQKNSSHQSCDENIKIDVSARKISAICCLIKSKSVDF